MTAVEFYEWIKGNVLLLMDNACHVATYLSIVRLELLPSKCTGSFQSLDAGIINSFKAPYREHQIGFCWLVIRK